ncbi:MAG: hypothetical protein KDK26_19095 [Roseivivax sp.]|nr:hypothetical protein [Roseivivax sp.]
MEAVIDALLDWIAGNSAYTTDGITRPIVVELSPEDLTREFYSGVPHLVPDDGVDERLNALYAFGDGPAGTIYILDANTIDGAREFDAPHDNPLWREILLHELVHHVQYQTGEADTWQCSSQGEVAAYTLGGRYLKQRYTDDPMGNRNFWARVYARC